MNKPLEIMQTKMKEAGFYDGRIDGIYGPKMEAGLERALALASSPVYQEERIREAVKAVTNFILSKAGA